MGTPDPFLFMSISNNIGVRRRPFRHYDGEQHTAACHLAGDNAAALKTIMAILHRVRTTRQSEVVLTNDLCQQFGVADRKAKARGLALWQALGVVEAHVRRGKNPAVRLVQMPGHVVARGRVRRLQVEQLSGAPAGSHVSFNDGTEARVGRDRDRRALRAAHAKAAFVDVELVDRGTGWLLDKLLPASPEWRPMWVVKIVPVRPSDLPSGFIETDPLIETGTDSGQITFLSSRGLSQSQNASAA